MTDSRIDEDILNKTSASFKRWIDETDKLLRPIAKKTNEEIFKFFNTFPNINEFKYTIGGVTYIIERETFMKNQSSKQ